MSALNVDSPGALRVPSHKIPTRDYVHRDYFMLEMDGEGGDAGDGIAGLISSILLEHPDWHYEYPARALDKYHVFSLPKDHEDLGRLRLIQRDGLQKRVTRREEQPDLYGSSQVRSVHLLPPKRLYHRAPVPYEDDGSAFSLSSRAVDSSEEVIEKARTEFGIDDPAFADQWHIINTRFPGHDVDVLPVWGQNITGNGVVTAIIDDGLDMDNPDLKSCFCPEGSWDYNDNTALPKPRLQDDYHGTRCAGEIAAAKGNNFCGVGVAWGSRVSGIRILSGELTSEDEAAAMVYGLDVNDIYSCSWGPPDNGKAMDVPDKIVREAILKGIQEGRDGKGALYVFASGNGALHGDSCNFDGYTNSIYSITVTAIDHRGLHPPYAESCAAVMVSTYSSGSGEHIHTTDFKEGCSARHGGTSAAAPLAAGLYALLLEANPELTWRDVQYLTVMSAVEVDSDGPDWQSTAIEGKRYSYKYGWGKLDAAKIVNNARDNYTLLKPQAWYYMPYTRVQDGGSSEDSAALKRRSDSVPSNTPPPGRSVSSTFYVSPEIIQISNLDHIEQITVTVNIESTKRGAVYVRLISPHGLVSRLAQERRHDLDTNGFQDWTFSTVAHWGESPVGNWTLEVTNTEPDKQTVKLNAWQLKLFGESIDPSKAIKFDMDEDYSKINEREDLTPSVTIPSPSSVPTSSAQPVLPSSHPGNSGSSGAHKHTVVFGGHSEFYFLFFLVAGFIVCIFLLKGRRKPGRARRRDEYEFDIINPEEDDSVFEQDSVIPSEDEDEEANIGANAASSPSEHISSPHLQDDELFNSEYREDPDAAIRTQNEERERLFETEDPDSDEEDLFRITSHPDEE
ncbi:DEKNAAC102938 [Brettanomyces naardenensis]|uniref:DEKNAAC102938 n=1 Tax=Brettanomyces naardenensis TaxID=13370 RepID=A0A448YM70_BRENA|nr:DEKNAAC102938 [Brettanomyces naardenensis]